MPETISSRIGTYTVLTKARGHAIVGDEPAALGGDGLGPAPVELLQAALAHCTIVTMVGEAKVAGFDPPQIEVRVTYKVNHMANGPSDPKQRSLRLTEIHKKVTVQGPIAPEYADLLKHASMNCPIGNTLSGGVALKETFEIKE